MPSVKVKLDSEWEEVWAVASQTAREPEFNDAFDIREATNEALATLAHLIPVAEGIEETKFTYPSLDGTDVAIHRFAPPCAASTQHEGSQRAIVFVFGGAMVAGSIESWRPFIRDLAATTESQVFAVHYRLAPEYRAPGAVEDVYAGVQWLQAEAPSFNVDPKRIVLHGVSAGGGISAGVALMARDKGLQHPISAMLLCYPMLDDRTVVPADHPHQPYFAYASHTNDIAWKAVLGRDREDRTDENVPIHAAPGRAKDLSGLPDTFIDAAGLDLLRDEAIAFATKLAADGNFVEFHLYPGVSHGFDHVRHMRVTKEAISNRRKFLLRY
ncbi:alpha/beta hydrolase fold-domain-containing protein [Xylariaceae sp. FL0594]|nr:alpha/beta hydrolase fold-domain-containing protein [Xylariaceae sp. FL0594]